MSTTPATPAHAGLRRALRSIRRLAGSFRRGGRHGPRRRGLGLLAALPLMAALGSLLGAGSASVELPATTTTLVAVTRRLSHEQAALYKEWIDNDRRLRVVVDEMRQAAGRAAQLLLEHQGEKSAKVQLKAEVPHRRDPSSSGEGSRGRRNSSGAMT